MDENCLVNNSFISKIWGKEERYRLYGISFNDPFEISFTAQVDHYKISVNDKEIAVFSHRDPLHQVNYICVNGNVKIEHIGHENASHADQSDPLHKNDYIHVNVQIEHEKNIFFRILNLLFELFFKCIP